MKGMWPLQGPADRQERLDRLTPEQWKSLAETLMPGSRLLVDGWLAFHIPPKGEETKR